MKTCLLIMKYFSTVHFLRVVKNAVKDGERITKRETFGEKIEDFSPKVSLQKKFSHHRHVDFNKCTVENEI